VGYGGAGDDDVIAAAGPPLAGDEHAASVRADDGLGVDAAPIVPVDGGDRLIVHRDQSAVDDPRMVAVVGIGSQGVGQHGHHEVERRLAGTDGGGQGPGCQVCSQVDENEQYPCAQW
jgi:alkylated DNA repair dioxygenase AlkB